MDVVATREYLDNLGIIEDMAKLYLTILKLKKFHYSDMYEYGESNYYIVFNIKTKILIDSLFENSRQYMIDSRSADDEGNSLLDIGDLVDIYAPFDT